MGINKHCILPEVQALFLTSTSSTKFVIFLRNATLITSIYLTFKNVLKQLKPCMRSMDQNTEMKQKKKEYAVFFIIAVDILNGAMRENVSSCIDR